MNCPFVNMEKMDIQAEPQLFRFLILGIPKKYRKGLSLEPTADELEEEPEAIRRIYEAFSGNPAESTETILNLLFG